jgi:small GTP-binding protein
MLAQPATVQKKICMLGSYAVGKTSLVRRFVESIFSERYLTTVGVKIDKKLVSVGGRDVTLVLWDLAGEDGLEQVRPSHLRGASGYILVADGCRRSTLDHAVTLQRKSVAALGPVPFVFALNKSDLSAEWEVHDADFQQLLQTGWMCYRTSAKTGAGVEQLFLDLAKNMLSGMDEPCD